MSCTYMCISICIHVHVHLIYNVQPQEVKCITSYEYGKSEEHIILLYKQNDVHVHHFVCTCIYVYSGVKTKMES